MLLGFWVDNWHLGTLHTFAALLGAGLSLYAMQMWSRGEIIAAEHPAILILRRGSLMVMALAMLWSVSYAEDKGWSPWPAQVLIVLAVDLGLIATIASAVMRRPRVAH